MPNNTNRVWEILVDDSPAQNGVKPTKYRSLLIGKGFKQLKFEFDVLIDFGGGVSYADLRLYNLSDETRGPLLRRGTAIVLVAGYEDNKDVIFTGKIENAFRDGNPPNVFLHVLCATGTQPNITKDPIQISLGKPAKTIDIIKQCASSMGYPINIDKGADSVFADYLDGYSSIGNPHEIMHSLAYDRKFNWLISDDKVIIVPANSFRQGAPHKISWETGMVGVPEVSEKGVDVSVRLNPKIKIGSQVDIESKRSTFSFGSLYYENIQNSKGTGIFKVNRISHSGDTHGDTWTSRLVTYNDLPFTGSNE